ncbi:MAG: sugar phosphate isomerase/epimerase family protein [Opitutales bacterium]
MNTFEIGLSMYSLRQLFESGELHALDYPKFAKETFGISKIDVWDGGYPDGWQKDKDFLPTLKQRAEAIGSEIFLVMTGMVDASPAIEGQLKKNGIKFTHAVDQAVILGAQYVRVFLKIDKEVSDTESIRRSGVALGALSDYARERGITIVIEPNPKFTPLGSYLAEVVATLGHSHCKLMPDFGKMVGTDFYQGTQDMMPHTAVVSAKGHDFNPDGTQKDFDYPRLIEIINSAGFSGIVAIEYEGRNLGPVEGVQAMYNILK